MEDQEKVWDATAERWGEFRTRLVDEVKEFLKNKRGKVLDLGCGSGRNFIKDKDLEFYGVDFSQKLLNIAKKSGKDYVELKKGTTDNIPYEEEFFDWIILARVLHCVESVEKRKKSLEEIYRVLKPGDEALISVWSRNSPRLKNKPKESFVPWTIGDKKYERYTYRYDLEELKDQLKNAGFKIISIREDKNIIAVVRKTL